MYNGSFNNKQTGIDNHNEQHFQQVNKLTNLWTIGLSDSIENNNVVNGVKWVINQLIDNNNIINS